MSKYILSRCNSETLNTVPQTDGQIIYVKDINKLYFDIDSTRVDFNNIICVNTLEEIINPLEGKLYYILDVNSLAIYKDNELHIIKSDTENLTASDITYEDISEIGASTVQDIIDYLITNMGIDKDTITQLSQAIEERRVEMKKYVDELVANTKTEITEYVDNSVKVVKDNLKITDKNVSDLQEATKSLQNTCLGYGYKIEKIDTDLGFLKDKVDTTKTDITTNTDNITKLEKKVTTNTDNITKNSESITTNTNNIKANTDNITQLQNTTQELDGKITDVDTKVDTTKTQLEENIKTTKETIGQEIQQTKDDLESEIIQKETDINKTIENNKTELQQTIIDGDNLKIDKSVTTDTDNKIIGNVNITTQEGNIDIETTKLDVTTNTSEKSNIKITSKTNDITITGEDDSIDITIPKLEELNSNITDVDNKVTTLQDSTSKQIETLQGSIDTNKQNIETLQEDNKTINQTVSECETKVNDAVTKVGEFEIEQQSQKERMTVMETNIESNRVTTKANTTAIDGLRNEMDSYHHYFKGYYQDSMEIQELEGQIGDYVYCGETQTIWVYSVSWENSQKPIPNQVVPKTQTTPLMNGLASVGTEDSYAPGDHVHPTDVTRASEKEFQTFKTDITNTLESKLNKTSEELLTNSKDIVGAINEIYNLIQEIKQ